MKGWRTCKLHEVADIFSGYAFKSADMSKEEGVPLIKIKNIFGKKVHKDCETYLKPEAFKNSHQKYYLKKDDFLVAMTGQGSVGRLGKMRSFEKGFLVNQRVGIVRVIEDIADPEFIYQSLATDDTEGMYFNLAMGAGQPNLSPKDIGLANIPLPPLPTQKKIAGILSAYDDAIENNLRRIKLLEEMAQITYEEWFVRLRFPGHTTTPINKTTGMPDGWKKKQIKDIGEVVTGKTPSTTNQDFFGDEVPFIKTPDMANAPYVISTTQSLSRLGANSQKNKYLPKNSLMVSCIGTAGATGLVAVASQTNQQINSIVFKDSAYCFFMYCFSRGLKPLLEGLGSNGATMTNVNKTKFEGIEFDCPAQDILVSYNAKVSLNFESILNLQYQNQRLREARDIILPRLMTGVIDAEKYQPENFLKKN